MSNVESFLEDGEEEPPPPPVRGWPLAVLVAVVSFFVWIFVGAAIGHSESSSSPGPTVTATVTVTVGPGSATTAATPSTATGPTVTTAAAGDLVPPAVGGRELVRFSGSGAKTSRTFRLTGDPFTLAYAYDCSAFGSTGAFQVNLERGSVQVDLLTNALGTADRGVTHGRQDPGSYYLLINSHCSWVARLTQ